MWSKRAQLVSQHMPKNAKKSGMDTTLVLQTNGGTAWLAHKELFNACYSIAQC